MLKFIAHLSLLNSSCLSLSPSHEEILWCSPSQPKPYGGLWLAKTAYEELLCLTFIPGHISTKHDGQILLGSCRYSKINWLEPKIKALPQASINLLREWNLTTVLVLAKNYHKIVHIWDSLIALVELWHPQTHTFIFLTFEVTILLEALEIIVGLPKDKKGSEHLICHIVALIDLWAILREITAKPWDLQCMTSPFYIHLIPLSQWIVSHCRNKSGKYLAIAKAAAICICGVILFPTQDLLLLTAKLSIICNVWEGFSISQSVLGYLYASLTSTTTRGPLYNSVIALECCMGMRIYFKATDDTSVKCLSLTHHPLSFVGAPLHITTQVWCKTAVVKSLKDWRLYLNMLQMEQFNMRPSFLHDKIIRLGQRVGLDLLLIGTIVRLKVWQQVDLEGGVNRKSM
ncbi:hypothetical protein Taro_032010 [Colocasia esculenta]|uniref:Uncharacterized protein n=1 Tax=Colocasia esculenta TaxID=4460 RepID=A0A843VRI5_COLES|nr:hypothetical protein [Colocasia esculenta]